MQIFPIAYAAPVGYYTKMVQAQQIYLELHEHFAKQTIRNHCNIATAHGAAKLTIPLAARKNKAITKDIKISYAEPWQKQHFRTITTAYNNSPYFEYYNYKLEPFFEKKYDFLLDFNLDIMQALITILKLDVAINVTDSYQTIEVQNDFRSINFSEFERTEYYQVFANDIGFINNLSIFDLLFNEGPDARIILGCK